MQIFLSDRAPYGRRETQALGSLQGAEPAEGLPSREAWTRSARRQVEAQGEHKNISTRHPNAGTLRSALRFVRMKKRAGISWVPVLLAGALLGLTDPAVASLKQVMVLEGPEIGFPPFMKGLKEEKLRLVHSGLAPAERTVTAESEQSRAIKPR